MQEEYNSPKRYQVFVSSTYEDLVEERKEVMQVLLELDCIPAGMELFPAADDESWTLIKRVIDNSDYYLVVVAGRYGSVGPQGVSYTQMEFEYALSRGKPIIAFIHGRPGSIPTDKTDQDRDHRTLLDSFKTALRKRNCKTWTTPQDLAAAVGRSIVHLIRDRPAVGWIRANQSDLLESALRKKQHLNELLQAQLAESTEALRISQEERPRDTELLRKRISELEAALAASEDRHPREVARLQQRVAELEQTRGAVQANPRFIEPHASSQAAQDLSQNVDSTEVGQILRRARERLGLRYRDVEELSSRLADSLRNTEFMIALSRLSDIENRRVVPSIFKLFSLAVIYRLDYTEILRWYGVELSRLPSMALDLLPDKTHIIHTRPEGSDIQVPLSIDFGLDPSKTTFLTRYIHQWGLLPFMLVSRLNLAAYRYGMMGGDDWSMFPIIHPGALLLIDETQRKIVASGWQHELERPIYLLEHRDGYRCCWCEIAGSNLFAIPHSRSGLPIETFEYPSEVDVIGRVIGIATRFGSSNRAEQPTRNKPL